MSSYLDHQCDSNCVKQQLDNNAQLAHPEYTPLLPDGNFLEQRDTQYAEHQNDLTYTKNPPEIEHTPENICGTAITTEETGGVVMLTRESNHPMTCKQKTEETGGVVKLTRESNHPRTCTQTAEETGATVKIIHTESESSSTQNDSDPLWGWLITFSSFLLMYMAMIPSTSFGILFSSFLLERKASATVTAWIFNLAFVASGFVTFLSGPVVEEFGWRRVTFVSGLLFALGLIISAFASSPEFLFFSFSVLTGSNAELLVVICYLVVPHYMVRWRTLANSLMTTGTCVSQMVMPPLVTYLQEEYGFRGATLITGALTLNCCVVAMVLHPVHWHRMIPDTLLTTTRHEPVKKFMPMETCKRILRIGIRNVRLLKATVFFKTSFVIATNIVVNYNIFGMMPFAMQDAGFSQRESSFCLTVAGVCNLCTRLLTAFIFICPRIRVRTWYMLGALISASSTIGFSTVTTLPGKVLTMGLCGAGYGITASLCGLYIVDELDLNKLLPTFSITNFMAGCLFLLVGPLAGVMRDWSDSYVASMWFCSICLLFSVVLGLFLPSPPRQGTTTTTTTAEIVS